jgi:hypothetical protein
MNMMCHVMARQGVEERWSLGKVCRALVDDAVHAKGCQDNVSVLLIQAGATPIYHRYSLTLDEAACMCSRVCITCLQLRHIEQSPSPKVAPSVDKLLVSSLKAAEANSDDKSSALG